MALDLSLPRAGLASQRRAFAHYPWHVAFLVLGIASLGVWNLASASRSAHAPVWISQLSWMGAGAAVALAIGLVDYRRFMRGAYVFYALVLLLLVATALKGRVVMGARRWLAIGPLNLQPSELAKIAVTMALARWFHMDASKRKDGYGLLGLAIPAAITLVPALLILKQPDLGTALIVVAVGATMILFAKVRWQALVTVGAGYHATQSMIAVGSGQGLGKGWGQGTQTLLSFLPEQHTDFIFSVWAEEHGFVGCLLLLALYYALVVSALGIAGNARDRFGHFLAIGVTAMLFWHAFINMGMVIGVLPVVGVTLPLMSYGGSSVVAIFAALGMLANISMRRFVN